MLKIEPFLLISRNISSKPLTNVTVHSHELYGCDVVIGVHVFLVTVEF